MPSDNANTPGPSNGLTIDPELRALIPPLSSAECTQLRDNLAANGCREPLTVWAGTNILLDGHHRHMACQELGLPYQTVEVDCADREAAKDWIDRNQLGRRNLNPDQMSLLRGRIYNRRKAGHGGDRRSSPQSEDLKRTSEDLADTLNVSRSTIERDGAYAEAAETLGIESAIVSGAINEPRQAVIHAAKSLPDVPTDEQVERAAKNLKKPRVNRKRRTDERCTPRHFIDAAVAVMGAIDCDPASSANANKIVRAATYHDARSNGLTKEWGKTVWLNPPLAHPLIGRFCTALREKVKKGEVEQACVLVGNNTETEWFGNLVKVGSAVVFTRGRVRFLDAAGNRGAALQGQAIVYIGESTDKFLEHFGKFGWGARLTDRTEAEGGRP